MAKRSVLLLPGAAAVAALLVTSCSSSSDGGVKTEGKTTSMTWVTTGNAPRSMQMAMYAVPKKLGYFDDEHLDVELRFSEGSTAGIQAVVSGAGLVTNADAGAVLTAAKKGLDLKAFAGVVPNWPWQFAVLDGSSVQSLTDLKGKSVGIISLASGSNDFAKAALEKAGLDPARDAHLVPVGAGPAAAEALKNGKVDALALYGEVYATMERAGLPLRYLENSSYFDDLYSIAFATTEKNLTSHKDVIEKFSRAAYKGLVFSSVNPEATVDIALEVFPDLRGTGGDAEAKRQGYIDTLKKWLESSAQGAGEPATWKDLGLITQTQWEATRGYAAITNASVRDVKDEQIWTDALLPAINGFDVADVAKKAAQYKSGK